MWIRCCVFTFLPVACLLSATCLLWQPPAQIELGTMHASSGCMSLVVSVGAVVVGTIACALHGCGACVVQHAVCCACVDGILTWVRELLDVER